MANTYSRIIVHYVFSTKNRKKIISKDLQEHLWPYIGGITRQYNTPALAVGGIENHVHIILSLSPVMPVSRAVQIIKSNSSKWVRENFIDYKNFRWQAGYGAFTVNIHKIDQTISYVENQNEHHRNRSFEDEYLALLKKYNIKYDTRYLWG